jgi:gamma-glutamyltranspeptidase/glutathione hydrolase
MHRPVIMGTRGMVASAHPLASLAGLNIRKRSGNAIDAAIATNAVLNVTQPHMCGIGGDLFYLIYLARTGEVVFLNGSGRAPRGVSWELYRPKGLEKVPPRSALAVTVPGCLAAWKKRVNATAPCPWTTSWPRPSLTRKAIPSAINSPGT